MSLRIALADDEPLARARLSRLLREAGCEVVAECPDGLALLEWLERKEPVDAIFLDIQMPGPTGMEIFAELKDPPPVVFVTAFSEYAIRAFEKAATDYILKPIEEGRLAITLNRLRNQQVPRRSGSELAALAAKGPQRFPVKVGEGIIFMELRRISHFEVEDEIVWACGGGRFRTQWVSLSEVEQAFPDEGLLRIQRHLLLRPEAVLGVKPLWEGRLLARVADGLDLEVSRSATPKLKARLGL